MKIRPTLLHIGHWRCSFGHAGEAAKFPWEWQSKLLIAVPPAGWSSDPGIECKTKLAVDKKQVTGAQTN
jgi:hypothetical protein